MIAWSKHIIALLACLPALIWAQEASGTFKSLRGQAMLEREGAKRPARAGEALYAKDRIITGADGFASVGFRDQSSLAIGPNADIDLSKFSFNPTSHRGEQQVRVRAGSLAAISGKVAKASPESVQFNAGSVTLGVRGTQFLIEVQAAKPAESAILWRDAQQQILRSADGSCWQSGSSPSGCPVEPEPHRFILLPDRSGQVGAITLSNQGQRVAVQEAYAGVEARDEVIRSTPFSKAFVTSRYSALIAALPPGPQNFVVRFATGSARQLTPDSQAVIEQVKAALANWPVIPNVDVVGHTDTAGRADQNDALSLQRAHVVGQLLDARALSTDRLHISGRGERQLLVPTPDETPEAQNRRVEITIY